ncbi:MAG: hypothetical protein H6713_02255 [Myxococcales bacterium]|nr:hypothetical protein [Myxococcales bacterium]MCB9748809.1 hypothetical protein [Myxococcales bacterium]
MQGRLQDETGEDESRGAERRAPLGCELETECAHTGRRIRLRLDRELGCEVLDEGAAPLVFVPLVNFERLRARSIIDDF